MRYSDDIIEEVRMKNDIVDVVIPWMEKIIRMEISFRSMNFMRQ